MQDSERQQRLEAAWLRHRNGDLDFAYREYHRLLAQCPDDARVLHYLGLLAHQTGHVQTAIDLIGRSISLDASDARAFNHLGQIYAVGRQLQEAERCFRAALALEPSSAHALNNLANVMRKMDRVPEALALYRQAMVADPHAREASYNLGKALRDTGAFDEALQAFERAIHLDPDNYRARYELALCLEELGRFEEARERYQETLRIEPNHARSVANLLALRSFVPEAPFVAHASELVASANIRDEERARLHQGIGKYHDRQGQFALAFTHFAASNAVQSAWNKSFDPSVAAAALATLTRRFDVAHFRSVAELGNPTIRPIFIVGMPRSGTTLVEQILGSHPDVHAAGELTHMPRIAARHLELSAETIRSSAQSYLDQLAQIAPAEATRVTDKLPVNYKHLGLIATLFPRARIIHCNRDPRDVALSCFIEMFNITDQDFTDLSGIAHAIVQEARLMQHWRAVLPTPIYDIHYERLIADQRGESQRLLEYCAVGWDERCLRFFETRRNVETPSRWQVRQRIYSTSVGRWRNYAEQLAPAIAILETAGLIEQG